MRRMVIIVAENVTASSSKSTQSCRGDAPRAAGHARGFEFHPDQVMEDQPDGSLIVRFRAAGWTESLKMNRFSGRLWCWEEGDDGFGLALVFGVEFFA